MNPAASPALARDPASKAARVWRRTRFGALLVAVLVGTLWATGLPESSQPVAAIGTVITVLLAIELAGMGRLVEWHLGVPLLVGTAFGSAAVVWAVDAWPGVLTAPTAGLGAALVAALAALGAVWSGRPRRGTPRRRVRAWLAVTLGLWALAPLPALALVREAFGHTGLVALLVLSKVGDVAGYYGGSAFGRHHPFKRLSPGKTTEGCVASALAGLLAGAALSATGVLPGTWWQGLVAGLVVNVAAQAGDLLESWVKRKSGVKDSGAWLGPSGGVLDVVDSLLLTVPVALVTWPLILR